MIPETFLSKIKINAETGCWEWTAAKMPDGYGMININGKTQRAHRLSYEFYNGEIPAGMCVCHRCDNPRCANPEHLFLGTQARNIADMDAKNRRARGNKVANKGMAHPLSKLTEADVIAIRSAKGISQRELAKHHGVSYQQVSKIVLGKRWAHL